MLSNKPNALKEFNKPPRAHVLFIGLACLIFSAITILLSSRLPFNGILTPLALLLGALIMRWPSLGLYISILLVLVCETFGTPDGITNFTSLPLININAITSIPLSATWLEIIIAWTILATIVFGVFRNQKVLHWWPLSKAAAILAANIAFSFVWGSFIKHGDHQAALWEVRPLVYIVVLYFITVALINKEHMYQIINWLFPIGGFILCLISYWRFFHPDIMALGGSLYSESLNGINHEDAVIFVICFMWCIHKILFKSTIAEKLAAWLMVVPTFGAVFTSGRRAAFASMAGCFIVLLIVLFVRQRKLAIVTIVILAIVFPPYLIAFRNVDGPLGLAARAFSSGTGSNQVGSRDYDSDLYRIIERSNVQLTIKQSPLLGIGFGQEFTRYTSMVDIESFTFQNFTPHVQVLWLWLKLGIIGWLVFWFIVCGAFFRMSQIIKYETDLVKTNLATLAGFTLAGFMIFAYVDISLANVRVCTLLGISIGILELLYQQIKRTIKTPDNHNQEEAIEPTNTKDLVTIP